VRPMDVAIHITLVLKGEVYSYLVTWNGTSKATNSPNGPEGGSSRHEFSPGSANERETILVRASKRLDPAPGNFPRRYLGLFRFP
jgi:hypothetical protein